MYKFKPLYLSKWFNWFTIQFMAISFLWIQLNHLTIQGKIPWQRTNYSKWINWFTITVHLQVIFFVKDSIESPNNSIGPRKIVQLVTCADLRPYTFTNCSINSLPYSLKNCSIDLLYNSRSYTLLVNASIDTIIDSHLQKRKKKIGGFEPCPCMPIV